MIELTFSAEFEQPVSDSVSDAIEDGRVYSAVDAHLTSSVVGVEDTQMTTYGGSPVGAYDYVGQPYVSLTVGVNDDVPMGIEGPIMQAWQEIMRYNNVALAAVQYDDARMVDA